MRSLPVLASGPDEFAYKDSAGVSGRKTKRKFLLTDGRFSRIMRKLRLKKS
jgi:hypothetical protein